MRKLYLDNLRSLTILLLFPVHTFMIYNNFGSKFYVWNGENNLLSSLITMANPWFMPLLFVISGIVSADSLKKRGVKNFAKERFFKLLVPFVFGLSAYVPAQTLYARKFFFGYDGGFFDHVCYFFTHVTDFSGNDGCFSPGHLWFILFLFIISFLALPFIKNFPRERFSEQIAKINIFGIICFFIPVYLSYFIGNFGGYSLGKCFTLYLLGYYVLSNGDVSDLLLKYKKPVIILFTASQLILFFLYYSYSYYGDLLVNFTGWLGILSFLILGKIFMNRELKLFAYLKKASFTVYLLHLPILVVWGYYVLHIFDNMFIQVITILTGSVILTFAVYEIIRRIPYLRKLFGIK